MSTSTYTQLSIERGAEEHLPLSPDPAVPVAPRTVTRFWAMHGADGSPPCHFAFCDGNGHTVGMIALQRLRLNCLQVVFSFPPSTDAAPHPVVKHFIANVNNLSGARGRTSKRVMHCTSADNAAVALLHVRQWPGIRQELLLSVQTQMRGCTLVPESTVALDQLQFPLDSAQEKNFPVATAAFSTNITCKSTFRDFFTLSITSQPLAAALKEAILGTTPPGRPDGRSGVLGNGFSVEPSNLLQLVLRPHESFINMPLTNIALHIPMTLKNYMVVLLAELSKIAEENENIEVKENDTPSKQS